MKKIFSFMVVGLLSSATWAMQPLADGDLQNVEGQAGADLSLKLTLNHNDMTYAQLQAGTKPTFNCADADLPYCRLAISLNKRFVDDSNNPVSDPTFSNPAYRLWLVAKGIQGTVNLQRIGLDGVKLNEVLGGGHYTGVGLDSDKPAIQISMTAAVPIQIRNLGFEALAIEKDGFTSYIDSNGRVVEPSDTSAAGYLDGTKYTNTAGSALGSRFDYEKTLGGSGRETGFMGLMMHGNLAVHGQVLIYSCNPTSTTRC